MDGLLAADPHCTAVYAANDGMAYGAVQALREHGRRVPEDVSVIGVDDSLNHMVPHNRMTTISQHIDRLGEAAMDEIVAHLERPDLPRRSVFIAPQLVVRGTTAPAA